MLTCFDVAKYFLAMQDEEAGDLISNLKLQKLVYYAQGLHLAIYNKSLFKEEIKAWQHGPVIPSLYHQYKRHENGAIPRPTKIDLRKYNKKVQELLEEVYKVFGQFSAWKLRNITHGEPPWKEVADNAGIITNASMKKYFKTQLVA